MVDGACGVFQPDKLDKSMNVGAAQKAPMFCSRDDAVQLIDIDESDGGRSGAERQRPCRIDCQRFLNEALRLRQIVAEPGTPRV